NSVSTERFNLTIDMIPNENIRMLFE
ncbi:MAG: hypothetical protein ACJAR4_001436, partial [Psychroserpens sp.]